MNSNFMFDSALSQGGENCKNILVKGDNLQVLPELLPNYSGKIKCIYIDPPYNNGDVYHYYKDNESQEKWLSGIKKVLRLLKPLLSEDGSIWISIDDSEMAYLKVEADKIFGRENFVATVVWQQRKTRENRAVFSCNHEYVLVYAKDFKMFKKTRNLLPVDDDFIKSKYKNPDNDPRGPWQSITASVQAGHAVASQFYTITTPAGVRYNPPKGRCWVYNEERMLQEIADNNIWFGLEGKNTPRIKKFLSNAKIGLTPQTLWEGDEVGTTDSAKKHLLSLFPNVEKVFDTPKPEGLIKQILDIATDENDYVLDCYLGSGTTVAVAHKMRRHYIGIEMGNQMSEIVIERMRKVVAGEDGGISHDVKWNGGGQFSFFEYVKAKETTVTPPVGTFCEDVLLESSDNPCPKIEELDFWEVKRMYPNYIVSNKGSEPLCASHKGDLLLSDIDYSKKCLVSYVKSDNLELFLDQSAKVYYTGKKFPATVALNKLYYFAPYLKGKGIRDLYLIKMARVGTRKEGHLDEDPNDLRLVFEIEFLGKMFCDYHLIELKIWHTFTDENMEDIIKLCQLRKNAKRIV